MTDHSDIRDEDIRPIGGPRKSGHGLGAALYDILGRTLDQDFAYEVGFGEFCAG